MSFDNSFSKLYEPVVPGGPRMDDLATSEDPRPVLGSGGGDTPRSPLSLLAPTIPSPSPSPSPHITRPTTNNNRAPSVSSYYLPIALIIGHDHPSNSTTDLGNYRPLNIFVSFVCGEISSKERLGANVFPTLFNQEIEKI